MDGDLRDDIVVFDEEERRNYWYAGSLGPAFDLAPRPMDNLSELGGLAMVDATGDGRADLVSAFSFRAYALYVGDGAGGFTLGAKQPETEVSHFREAPAPA